MSQKKVQLLNPLSGNINVAGVITASSFVGSGEGLTGVASTDNIQTATEATFLSGVKITGVTTASGGVVGNLTGNVTGNATGLSGTPNITVGSVTAASGSFSGNVTIGGTLTYQDVEHIDSVGIITAQQGIQVLSNGLDVTGFSTFKTGVVVTGVATATSFSGNVTGNLTGDVNAPTFDTGVGGVVVTGVVTATSFSGSGADLTGIESGVANFVASGTIPNGATVVVNTDGTVGVITQTAGNTATFGTAVVFESADTQDVSATFDSNSNKVVVAYKDVANSNYGTAVVGTIDTDGSISFGGATVFESADTRYISATFDSNSNKVVIAYKDQADSERGKAIVGTVSGTSISFGSAAQFESGVTFYISATFDSSNNKVVIAYMDNSNNNYGTAVVGTVSGTSISFGTPVVFESTSTSQIAATFDSSNNKVVIGFDDGSDGDKGHAIVGTVSGTSISFGTLQEFEGGDTNDLKAVFDSSSNKVVFAYTDGGNSDQGTAIVGTVSGTSISFGTAVTFGSGTSISDKSIAYDSNSNKIIIAYADGSASDEGNVVVGTVSGTSISFGSEVVFESGAVQTTATVFDTNTNKFAILYEDDDNNDYGTGIVGDVKTTNLTAENYIGIAAEAISDGATGKITVPGGINTGQTGLTTARKHFVKNDGTGISTIASSPSVVAGTAISATKILVR